MQNYNNEDNAGIMQRFWCYGQKWKILVYETDHVIMLWHMYVT